ncbi:MAG: EAL domain-containing protein [Oscillospiraceae bacterium]|nr:EAL domain-containing protein [Oscillospiraceae bacterium]
MAAELSKKRKKKRKKYYRMRKNRVGASLFMFLLNSLIMVGLVHGFAFIFMISSINSNIEDEYKTKSALVRIYEMARSSGSTGYEVFDTAGLDYFIRNKDGSIGHTHGKITCSDSFFSYDMPASYGDPSLPDDELVQVDLYYDTEDQLISKDSKGGLGFDVKNIMKIALDRLGLFFGAGDSSADDRGYEDLDIEMPLWMGIDMKDGEQTLVFKADIGMRSTAVGSLIIVYMLMIVLFVVILITMIIDAVTAATDHHRLNQLIFTDMKIKAKNWLWFMYNAEQKLEAASTRRHFALADVEFVGFRRFCACNSIDEGETMMSDVYNSINRLIDKKELCAYNAEGRFALMLEYTDKDALKERMDKMLSELGNTGHESAAAFHAGVFLTDANNLNAKEIDIEAELANASAACASLADNEGTAVAFYDEKFIEEQRWIDTVAQIQQKAVDNEEFMVYYQPKYDPRTNELRGAEALIRWQSPEYGFLPPYKFIPIFEKNGFITEIDHYMLTHAARDQKKWLDAGLHCVPVSVNVSRAHFIEDDLAEQIRDIVDSEGTPHELIEIELTESAFFDDKKAMIRTISRLQSYGFAVSMDDFGSGYSSLNSLKDMPLNVLKLDAEFFRGEQAGTDRGEIVVSEAIRLAKSLDMRTVAEGVEVKEQVELLASLGCDMIQGYYYAKPMPSADYEQCVRAGRSDPESEDVIPVKLDKPGEKEPVPV